MKVSTASRRLRHATSELRYADGRYPKGWRKRHVAKASRRHARALINEDIVAMAVAEDEDANLSHYMDDMSLMEKDIDFWDKYDDFDADFDYDMYDRYGDRLVCDCEMCKRERMLRMFANEMAAAEKPLAGWATELQRVS